MMINPEHLLFACDEEGVRLCYGQFALTVCDDPEDFARFKQILIEQLDTIEQELEDEYL